MKTRFIHLVASIHALALMPILAACSPADDATTGSQSEVVRPIKTAVVTETFTQINRTYSAVVLPAQEVELSFRVSGTINQLPIRGGMNVKMNDIIAQLDTRDFKAEIDRVESQIDQAEAQLMALTSGARAEDLAALEAGVNAAQEKVNAAKDQLQRSQTLFDDGVVTKAKVDSDRTNLRVAEADLETRKQELLKGQSGAREEEVAAQEAVIRGLQSNLKTLNDNLSDATLRAPFDGIIAVRKVENFSNIQAKEPIATLQSLAEPDLQFDIPAPDVPLLAAEEGLMFSVSLDGFPNLEFEAQQSEFSTRADTATQTYRGRVSITNPERKPILPGMSGAVTISGQKMESASFSVPVTAVGSEPDGTPFVWIVDMSDETVSKRTVEVGSASQESIIVLDGVEAGETIVTAGLAALREEMKVKPISTIGN